MKKAASKKKGSSSSSSSTSLAAATATAAAKQTRAAMLDSLDSADEKLRMEGCSAIASKFEPQSQRQDELATMRKEIQRLAKDGLFPSLVKCARDEQHPIVRLSAIGALRNLAILGGDKAVSLMQQADAWSALVAAIELGDARNKDIDLALKRESLRVMDTLCESSSAVAERRLPESLDKLAGACFVGPTAVHPHVLESACKLLHRATQGNLPLAQALAQSEAGKQIGSKLEALARFSGGSVLTSAYAFGSLVNLCLVSQPAGFAALLEGWLGGIQRDLFSQADASSSSSSILPLVADDSQVLADAVDLEENDMDEDGKPKSESAVLQEWLDRVQAQTIVLDVLAELFQEGGAPPAAQLQQHWLAVCLHISTAVFSREQHGPNVLVLPVAKLQQAAAECAAAAIEQQAAATANSSTPLLINNSFFQLVQVLGQVKLSRDTRERSIALANCLLAICSKHAVPLPPLLLGQLHQLQSQCALVPVRAILAHVLAKLATSTGINNLAPVAQVLIQSTKEDASFVVVCEAVDVLIDLFSADEAQLVLTSLGGTDVFDQFLARFERRFTEWKRSGAGGEGDADEDEDHDSLAEKMCEARENAQGFVAWRRSLKL